MILTGSQITKEVKGNNIAILPFDESLVNPNSYNYRLGPTLYEVISNPIDSKKPTEMIEHTLTKRGFVLMPGKLYLGHTYESIGSDKYVTSLIGRSSMGRLGMFLQITADLGHLGAKHCWTLEIEVVQPLKVYPMMRIGQVSFWESTGGKEIVYNGKYAKYSNPYKSEIFLELQNTQ